MTAATDSRAQGPVIDVRGAAKSYGAWPVRPTCMKAVLARTYGGPEVLTLEDLDRPKPEANQVLVEVRAAATNPSYWHRRWECAQ